MPDKALIGHSLMAKCNKFVTRHKPLTQKQWLARMQELPELDLEIDLYGSGPAIQILESKVADLLGKESALFFHKGMVSQHSALLEWSKRNTSKKIAIHPQSHMEVDESLAYKELLGLESVMFGQENSAIKMEDIETLTADMATAVVELPVRRAGFKLPEWETLKALKNRCNELDVPVHFDGGRLWESADYWKKSYAQVCELADSVYVSMYKSLGAAAGGIIAGDRDFIESLKPWQSRLGGNLYTVFPYVLTSLWGLEHYLPRMPEFIRRAANLSALIKKELGESAVPNTVQTNGFVVELEIEAGELEKKAFEMAKEQKIWLFDRIMSTEANTSRFEIQVGDALDDWTDEELILQFKNLLNN